MTDDKTVYLFMTVRDLGRDVHLHVDVIFKME